MKRVKNRKYEIKTVIICLLLFILIVIMAYIQEIKATEVVTYKYHIVQAGEYLDAIANKYYPNTYVLKARSDIKKLNNMTESDLTVGQVLKIEVK